MRPSLNRLTHPRRLAVPPRRQHRVLARGPAEPQTTEMPTLEAPSPERRSRDAGGPQDSACYECTCGYVFSASVSTSVSCPHCGQGQAW